MTQPTTWREQPSSRARRYSLRPRVGVGDVGVPQQVAAVAPELAFHHVGHCRRAWMVRLRGCGRKPQEAGAAISRCRCRGRS